MTHDTLTAYANDDLGLILYVDVARALNIKSGQRLTEAEAWEALAANARHGIRLCRAEISAQGGDHA